MEKNKFVVVIWTFKPTADRVSLTSSASRLWDYVGKSLPERNNVITLNTRASSWAFGRDRFAAAASTLSVAAAGGRSVCRRRHGRGLYAAQLTCIAHRTQKHFRRWCCALLFDIIAYTVSVCWDAAASDDDDDEWPLYAGGRDFHAFEFRREISVSRLDPTRPTSSHAAETCQLGKWTAECENGDI